MLLSEIIFVSRLYPERCAGTPDQVLYREGNYGGDALRPGQRQRPPRLPQDEGLRRRPEEHSGRRGADRDEPAQLWGRLPLRLR